MQLEANVTNPRDNRAELIAELVGVTDEDLESDGVRAAALICRDLSPLTSNWRATGNLDGLLDALGAARAAARPASGSGAPGRTLAACLNALTASS